MLARAPVAALASLSAHGYVPHALHALERDWPETNCYVDVWIEILHALGEDPAAALGFTAAQDFEGDHFTFSKFPIEDLREQFGLEVGELALYDTLEAHLGEQIRRGRIVLVEADAFVLPNTRGTSYRTEHTKTTIAVNRIEPGERRLDYFHSGGFFTLDGADYDALVRPPGLFPYAEFVKLDRRTKLDLGSASRILRRHVARRPVNNPVAAFRDRVREQAVAAADMPAAFLHKYVFNNARQLGMNFELLGSHLAWLDGGRAAAAELGPIAETCRALSSGAKSLQFQLARAITRRRFDGIETLVDPLVDRYNSIFERLAAI